jgi:predicted Zn-dependent protease
MRELAAAAQLQLGRADAARKLLDERTGEPPNDAGSLDLEARVGKALAANDLAGAVDVLLKVLRRTPVEDAAFRLRLVDWMEHKLKLDPGATAEVRLEADKHAALFQLPECPVEMRQQFDQLRAAR